MTSTIDVLGNAGTAGYGLDSTIFLQFDTAMKTTDGAITNRIMLRCDTCAIRTNKIANSTPLPFSGLVRGESTAIVLDLGMASKSVDLGGIIHDQIISRRYGTGDPIYVSMTAQEIAQLLHSSVDSSFIQKNQNISQLFIMIPSRVGNNYSYHTGVSENTPLDQLPLIPFTWASRTNDKAGSTLTSDFPNPDDSLQEIKGISGFIDNISTNFQPGNIVTFNIGFQEAFNISLSGE